MQFDLRGEGANTVIKLLLHFRVPANFKWASNITLATWQSETTIKSLLHRKHFHYKPPRQSSDAFLNFLIFTSPQEEAEHAFWGTIANLPAVHSWALPLQGTRAKTIPQLQLPQFCGKTVLLKWEISALLCFINLEEKSSASCEAHSENLNQNDLV